jgi:hypothetical protein
MYLRPEDFRAALGGAELVAALNWSPSRRQTKRKPSCSISNAHCEPVGTMWP